MTELEAVNLMLNAIGESPVDSLTNLHPDVVSSRLLLKQARLEVSAPGRWFNTRVYKALYNRTPALELSLGEVSLPSNAISIDCTDTNDNYILRSYARQKVVFPDFVDVTMNLLYDINADTTIITKDIELSVVYDLSFDNMPFPAQNLATYNAAHALQSNFVGDERKLLNLTSRWKEARLAFNAAELKAGDYNARNSSAARKLLSGVRRYTGGGR